jgi:hypothetical protein
VRSEAWFQLSICEILSVFCLGIFFPFRFEKMNRSFRAQDSQMQMQAAVVKQRQQLRATMMKEKEEELALFLEMKKREKEQNNLLLINNTEEFDAPLGNNVFFFFKKSYCRLLVTNLLGLWSGEDDYLV